MRSHNNQQLLQNQVLGLWENKGFIVLLINEYIDELFLLI